MNNLLLVVVAMQGMAVSFTSADTPTDTAGVLSCQVDLEGLCRPSLEQPRRPRSFYWIEEMDPYKSAWDRVAGPFSKPVDLRKRPLEGGRLYRVNACSDRNGKESCLGSTAYWSVFQPMSSDSIPDDIDDGRGVSLQVSRKLSLKAQKQQYNLYLLMRLMNGVDDMKAMPPMTPSPFPVDLHMHRIVEQGTEDEIIQHRVYQHYEARRVAQTGK